MQIRISDVVFCLFVRWSFGPLKRVMMQIELNTGCDIKSEWKEKKATNQTKALNKENKNDFQI